ncbi:HAMP domain-containing sensor histidine kinase [Streptomyces sp. NPDC006510]|uniref:HAMP domain-containing sensor histidine kinase n=1 Tax=Streptomyces sp. NPDC006510 TaxID=3155600 RepID=UPI0033B950AA
MRISRRLRPRSLRTRLVLIATVLATSAVLVCQAAGLTVMRSWLTDQIDERLTDFRPPSPVYRDVADGNGLDHRARTDDVLPSDYRVFFYGANGRLLSESLGRSDGEPRLPHTAAALKLWNGRPTTVPAETGDGSWRVVADSGSDGMRAVVALPLDTVEGATSKLLWFSLAIGTVVAAAVMVLGSVAVRLGLRPLNRVEDTARRITHGELALSVTETSPDTEVGRLGIAFNTMLDQLRAALHRKDAFERRLRRFMADAGHELRTPLTSIQGFSELLLQQPAMAPLQRNEAHELIARNADRMSRLVDDLLMLAQIGDTPAIRRELVDLLSLAADGVTATALRHPDRDIRLVPLADEDTTPGELDVVEALGDPHQLAQVIGNLLANACTHTPSDTRIEVRVGTVRTGPRAGGTDRAGRTSAAGPMTPGIPASVIEVADDGPGLAADDAHQVFERFYRACHTGAVEAQPGSGLGLAIASTIAEAHGGRLELDTGTGEGCTFRLLVPETTAPKGHTR